MPQQLTDEQVAQIIALETQGKGGKLIAKELGISLSTQSKYRNAALVFRNQRKEQVIDRSFDIIDAADKIVLEKIDKMNAYQAAVIGKIQTDRLLDLQDPQRGGVNIENKVLVVPSELLGKYKINADTDE